MTEIHSKQLTKIPQHVAIIMDGNGRWARQQNLSRIDGHKKGSEVARKIVSKCSDLGISFLTLYAFSSENWRRSPNEVSGLMELLQHYLETEAESLNNDNVRLRIIGERQMLPNNILRLVEAVELMTKDNTGITLIMALSYGSHAEITHAAKAVAQKVRDHCLTLEEITDEVISQHLYTHDIPDPDVLIRTSGEQRISNYLLWQLAYTELVFVDTYWPDFTPEEFVQTLLEYQERERRFGTAA